MRQQYGIFGGLEYLDGNGPTPVTDSFSAPDYTWNTKGNSRGELNNKPEVTLRLTLRVEAEDYGVIWETGAGGDGSALVLGTDGILYFHTGNGGSSGTGNGAIELTTPLTPGDRIIEFSRSSQNDKAALYIDGVLEAQDSISGLNPIGGSNNGGVLQVYGSICKNNSGTSAAYTGGQNALLSGAYIWLNRLTPDVQ